MREIKVLKEFRHVGSKGTSYLLTPGMKKTGHLPAAVKEMAVKAGAAEPVPDKSIKKNQV